MDSENSSDTLLDMSDNQHIDPHTMLVHTRFEIILIRIVEFISVVIFIPIIGLFLLIFAVPLVRNINLYTSWKFEIEVSRLWMLTTLSVLPIGIITKYVLPIFMAPIRMMSKKFSFLFPAQESLCSKCGRNATLVHGYRREKEEEDPQLQVCTKCLVSLLEKDLQKYDQPLVFSEPLLEEQYGFISFSDGALYAKLTESAGSYLPDDSAKCQKCENLAHYAWIPNDAILPGRYTPMAFYPKGKYVGASDLCRDHLLERLETNLIERNHRLFIFDSVKTKASGYFF